MNSLKLITSKFNKLYHSWIKTAPPNKSVLDFYEPDLNKIIIILEEMIKKQEEKVKLIEDEIESKIQMIKEIDDDILGEDNNTNDEISNTNNMISNKIKMYDNTSTITCNNMLDNNMINNTIKMYDSTIKIYDNTINSTCIPNKMNINSLYLKNEFLNVKLIERKRLKNEMEIEIKRINLKIKNIEEELGIKNELKFENTNLNTKLKESKIRYQNLCKEFEKIQEQKIMMMKEIEEMKEQLGINRKENKNKLNFEENDNIDDNSINDSNLIDRKSIDDNSIDDKSNGTFNSIDSNSNDSNSIYGTFIKIKEIHFKLKEIIKKRKEKTIKMTNEINQIYEMLLQNKIIIPNMNISNIQNITNHNILNLKKQLKKLKKIKEKHVAEIKMKKLIELKNLSFEFGLEINENLTLEEIIIKIDNLKLKFGIFTKIKNLVLDRKNLINSMIEFERSASDKMRLFRSSIQLLNEEKFRKCAVPSLIKIEKELSDLIEEYENEFKEKIAFKIENNEFNRKLFENEIKNRIINKSVFIIGLDSPRKRNKK